MTTRVGMLSGGEASWAAMKRDAERRGVEGLTLLFTDTKEEDADTYRFLRDSAANVGASAGDGRRRPLAVGGVPRPCLHRQQPDRRVQ